jgi:hypothetical protein
MFIGSDSFVSLVYGGAAGSVKSYMGAYENSYCTLITSSDDMYSDYRYEGGVVVYSGALPYVQAYDRVKYTKQPSIYS